MSRGESYGGGQSSLGYLFGGSDDKQQKAPPLASSPVYSPPYGIDTSPEKPPENPPSAGKQNIFNNYNIAQGQNSAIFPNGRPSTKVNSVPGGDSSLGYLFGDKS